MIARTFRQLAALLTLALLPALVSGAIQLKWSKPEPLAVGDIRAATVKMWGDKVLWVDARSRARFDAGHIAGAVLLNEDEWEKLVARFLDEWDPAKAIVVYCDGGGCESSHAVAGRLRTELKLDNVWVLKGGWPTWREK